MLGGCVMDDQVSEGDGTDDLGHSKLKFPPQPTTKRKLSAIVSLLSAARGQARSQPMGAYCSSDSIRTHDDDDL